MTHDPELELAAGLASLGMDPQEAEADGDFSGLVEQEWQALLDKDDRTSPTDYPEMCLLTHAELTSAMQDAFFLGNQRGRWVWERQTDKLLAALIDIREADGVGPNWMRARAGDAIERVGEP